MNANTKVNLEQIKSLRNSKIQSAEVKEILEKRTAQARKEVSSLRNFVSKKPGSIPAENCNRIADEIEKWLNG
jgi:hypothetical protein